MDSFSTLEVDEHRDLTTSPADEETTELTAPLAAVSSEKCPNCGAGMAPDQRYCIQCGERRSGGGLRDALPRTQTTAVAAAPARRIRMTPSSSLIAGIATLLLAMGVGVLIGRTGDHSTKSAGSTTPYQVVIPGGAAGAATSTAGTAVTSGTSTKKASSKKSKAAHSGGASKTRATTKVKLPPPVVKVGAKCTPGAKGCQQGKFTGNFFGQ